MTRLVTVRTSGIVASQFGDAQGGIDFYINTNSILYLDRAGISNYGTTSALSSGGHVIGFDASNSGSAISVDGSVAATGGNPAFIAPLFTHLFSGRTASGGPNGATGDIVVTKRLNAAKTAQLEGYLAWKYGLQALLPAGHTCKNARPHR